MKKYFIYALLIIFVAFVGIQLVPVKRDNPPVTADVVVSPAVRKILKRSCFDCHSNETNWPWYSFVAPVSWLVADHVADGRKKLNFSEWGDLSEKKQEHRLRETWKEISKGEMPIKPYLYLHKSAELSDDDKSIIKNWIIDSGVDLKKTNDTEDNDDDDDHDDH